MPIERRCSPRTPIALKVRLHHPAAGEINAVTRNVSIEGMFVETDATALSDKTELEVSFITSGDAGPRQHRVSAYVVHRNEAGIGLMLRHVAYSDFHAVRFLLEAA